MMKKFNFCLWSLLLCASLFSASAIYAKDISPNLALARQLNEAFVEVAEKVSPAVVVITVTQKPGSAPDDEEEDGAYDSFPREFRRYFRRPRTERSQGQGSGVIIREDGFILTNGHVLEDVETIEVRLKDGRTFKAKIRGIDPLSDVAVVKIDAKSLPTATLADSTKTRVGEFAIAIGAPFNLDYSVTFGHVSAKGRSNVVEGKEGESMDQDFIQTDANINPGNSGGPLINIDGEVIGINTLIRGLRTGIGFAIPSSLAKEISDELISEGKFPRVWLGIKIQSFRDNPELTEVVKGIDDGVVVNAVMVDGPAAKSDLHAGDIVTAVDGQRVGTPQQLRSEIRHKRAGQEVLLDVFRKDKPVQIKVNPGEWPTDPAALVARAKHNPSSATASDGIGLTVHTLTREIADRFAVSMTPGVIVVTVEKNTIAARKGIKPGDIITAVDQKPVLNPKQFHEALKKADLKKGVPISLVSGDTSRFEILKEDEN